ncbi:McrB family protein [Metapseudomonas otitidis]|uniref:McrB family protein n=1 Tax=Metapseudomonas otitidis TaxID=319939 RepID=UPI003EDED1EE
MPAFISLARIEDAVLRLCSWRGTVKAQSTAHIFPLLALLEKGVKANKQARYEESYDFDFFDRYCRVGNNSETPYFDPFSRELRIASHPHSNIATARKNTFQSRWHAAKLDIVGDMSYWTLDANFAGILASKLESKGNPNYRLNVVDLGCWLFRSEEFPDGATSADIQDLFRKRFPMEQDQYDQLFEYQAEPAGKIFQGEPVTIEAIDAMLLNIVLEDAAKIKPPSKVISPAQSDIESIKIQEDDSILVEVKALLKLGTSGIILSGAPGTGKSWYADQIALALTHGKRSDIFRVQFHPSFSYEDFFDGYVPAEHTKSGFEIKGKVFRKAIEAAHSTDGYVVLIVDEINRGNTSKIFGEALTYIEQGWRGVPFTPRLATEELTVPKNLLILATMNPHDRSITPLDMALLRRFDHVSIPPSSELVGDFLAAAGMSTEQANQVGKWFASLQELLPFGLGHTFFIGVSDIGQLGLIWRYRIQPFCISLLEYEPQRLEDIRRSYEALEQRLRDAEE